MTQVDLKTALQQARDALKIIGQAAVADSVGTYDYVTIKPNAYPVIEFTTTQGTNVKTSATQQTFTFGVRMVITCAEFGQGFEGQAQDDAQFDILPSALQYFEQHGTLITQSLGRVRYLDSVNSRVASFSAGIQSNKIVLILNWNLIFITNFQRC